MKTDVVIVGAGPVGLTSAHLLARFGLRAIVLERGDGPCPKPGAVCVDDEAMRVWQACGLERDFEPYWESGNDRQVICRYLDHRGSDFLQIRQSQSDLGYPQAIVIRQQDAGIVLWSSATRQPSIQLSSSTHFRSLRQTEHGVAVSAEHEGSPISIQASWVIGCDGGESAVRQSIGVELPARRLDRRWLVVEVSDDGARPCAEIHCGTEHTLVSVPLPGGHRRIEYCLSAGDDGHWIQSEAQVEIALAGVLKQLNSPKIEAWRVCQFRSGVADRWRVGRVFLAGDAAHVTSPFAGQGMCSGLRDASNLCFKIAGVTQGWLDESVLDTYEAERKPHQEHLIRFADRLGRLMMPKSCMRATIEQSALRHLSRVKSIRRRIEMRGASVRPVYDHGYFGRGRLSGRCLPQPIVMHQDGSRVRLDALLGQRMTWVVTGDGSRKGVPTGIRLRSSESILVEGRDFVDPSRRLQDVLGRGSCALVRPDRFIHTHLHRRERNRYERKGLLCLPQPQPA